VLRRLWTERSVTFDGRFDRITAAGISPPPVQRPIPVWFGATSPAALRRAGRLADGWFPPMSPGPKLDEARQIVEQAAADAGRDPAALGMEGRIILADGGAGAVAEKVEQWARAGATHVGINTMGAGLATVDDHIAALTEVAGLIRR
jgi:hypothetical protein